MHTGILHDGWEELTFVDKDNILWRYRKKTGVLSRYDFLYKKWVKVLTDPTLDADSVVINT